MMIDGIRAIFFDVFGTVVDWRGSLIADFSSWSNTRGLNVDWPALIDAWRAGYMPAMDSVRRNPDQEFLTLDALHRQTLEGLVEKFGLADCDANDLDYLTGGWHRLGAWSDGVEGLRRLKSKFSIAPLSNGNVSLLVDMAKHASLPWDMVFGADLFRHYKPDREIYLGAAKLLDLAPEQVLMVAAHNNDLMAARAYGLRTCFVPRPREFGAKQTSDLGPASDWTLVVDDLVDLADRFGC